MEGEPSNSSTNRLENNSFCGYTNINFSECKTSHHEIHQRCAYFYNISNTTRSDYSVLLLGLLKLNYVLNLTNVHRTCFLRILERYESQNKHTRTSGVRKEIKTNDLWGSATAYSSTVESHTSSQLIDGKTLTMSLSRVTTAFISKCMARGYEISHSLESLDIWSTTKLGI